MTGVQYSLACLIGRDIFPPYGYWMMYISEWIEKFEEHYWNVFPAQGKWKVDAVKYVPSQLPPQLLYSYCEKLDNYICLWMQKCMSSSKYLSISLSMYVALLLNVRFPISLILLHT